MPVPAAIAQSDTPTELKSAVELNLQLPDPEDDQLPEFEFQQKVGAAWLVCDRFDLQTEIWRGRILRVVRDREKRGGEGRGSGFLHWLQEREISKSQAYGWIELANSADELLSRGHLDPGAIENFSKRAFVETAQSVPEVQQLVSESANQGERITRREVRQLADEWTAMTSEVIPEAIKTKAADQTIPARYLAPLARELEKLPASHQAVMQEELTAEPDLDTLKQVTAEARHLAKYLQAAAHVQALSQASVDLEAGLEEAQRIGCLNSVADLVNQAAQLEQTMAKLFTTWKRILRLSDKVDVESGASTPHLRSLLQALDCLSGEVLTITLGPQTNGQHPQTIQIHILTDTDERHST
jgi:hypothetical protein